MNYPVTPDGRYFVVDHRLWRCTNPALKEDARRTLVRELMAALRAVRAAGQNDKSLRAARHRVHRAKVQLGERGPVWWEDGTPDYNRRPVDKTPYWKWYQQLLQDEG